MIVQHKRGATFIGSGVYKNAQSLPVDLTGRTVTSQVRTRGGKLVGNLAVTLGNQTLSPGSFVCRAESAATGTWPLGTLLWDIRITGPEGTTITETVEVEVLREATEAA